MSECLEHLHVGDKIYTDVRFTSDKISVLTIVGETPKAWLIKIAGSDRQVRKKDGYLIGSNTGGRCPDYVYFHPVTPEIIIQYKIQVLYSKMNALPRVGVKITPDNLEEIRAALEILYRHVPAH